MDPPSVVTRLHGQGRRRPGSLDRTDLGRLREFLDPSEHGPETVGLALETITDAVEANPRAASVVVPSLVGLLEADRREHRTEALSALVAVSGATPSELAPEVPRIVARFESENDDECRARLVLLLARVVETDPEALEAVADVAVDGLDDGSLAVRANAARAVAALADADPSLVRHAVPSLVDHLQAPVAGLRIDAARALAAISGTGADDFLQHDDALFAALDDENRAVRAQAMRVVANVAMADPPAVAGRSDRLLSALDDPATGETAVEALMAAAVTAPGETARRLVAVVSGSETTGRENAERTLRGIAMRNPAPVVDVLGDAIDDESRPVRQLAATVLCAVAEHRPSRTVPVIPKLVARIDDTDASVREAAGAAVRTVAAERPSSLAPCLDELVAAVDREPTGHTVEALARVVAADPNAIDAGTVPTETLLEAEDVAVRAEACRIAGSIGEETVVERVRDLVDDPNESVRDAAVAAMGELAGRGVITLTDEERRRLNSTDGSDRRR